MSKTKTAEFELPLDGLPLGWLAKSCDGHVFEIDLNRYNGIAFVRFPNHVPTLAVLREVFCQMSEACMLDDLLDDWESMPQREYGGVRAEGPYTMNRDAEGLYLVRGDGLEVRFA